MVDVGGEYGYVECQVEYDDALGKNPARQNTFRSPMSAMAEGFRLRADVSMQLVDQGGPC